MNIVVKIFDPRKEEVLNFLEKMEQAEFYLKNKDFYKLESVLFAAVTDYIKAEFPGIYNALYWLILKMQHYIALNKLHKIVHEEGKMLTDRDEQDYEYTTSLFDFNINFLREQVRLFKGVYINE